MTELLILLIVLAAALVALYGLIRFIRWAWHRGGSA